MCRYNVCTIPEINRYICVLGLPLIDEARRMHIFRDVQTDIGIMYMLIDKLKFFLSFCCVMDRIAGSQ